VEQALEVLRALRPAMATQPQAMLIIISTTYASNGPFFDAFRAHFGVADARVLFGRATTQQMNPVIDETFIADEMARDPVSAAAEYMSQFRTDVASFLDIALVDSVTRSEPRELPRGAGTPSGAIISYVAGIDVSGGRGDAAAAAVAHADGDRVIVDACRRWPAPHDPAAVAAQVAEFLAVYGLTGAVGDHYGAELARTIYTDAGVALTASEAPKSDVYLRLLPLLTTGAVELPPEPTLRGELIGLERRTSRGGKDSIDHRPGTHDDLANAVALAAVAAARTTVSDVPVHVEPGEFATGYGYATNDHRISVDWSNTKF
jgi:hypothetical protein